MEDNMFGIPEYMNLWNGDYSIQSEASREYDSLIPELTDKELYFRGEEEEEEKEDPIPEPTPEPEPEEPGEDESGDGEDSEEGSDDEEKEEPSEEEDDIIIVTEDSLISMTEEEAANASIEIKDSSIVENVLDVTKETSNKVFKKLIITEEA